MCSYVTLAIPQALKGLHQVTRCLVQQLSKAGTLKWSNDSWVPQHKMIEASVKDRIWQENNLCVMLCPFRRDKDWDFDSLFQSGVTVSCTF